MGPTQIDNNHKEEACSALASSRVSNRQLLPSSVTSFHHRRPTSSLPATFFVCSSHRGAAMPDVVSMVESLQGCGQC